MPGFGRPWKLRTDAKRGWLAQYRAYHESGALYLRCQRREPIPMPGRNSGRRGANDLIPARNETTEGNDRCESARAGLDLYLTGAIALDQQVLKSNSQLLV